MGPALRAICRGIALTCPVCGKGPLFAGYNRLVRTCAHCATDFEASRGEWTGALMFAQGIFGMVALGGWYVLFLIGLPMLGPQGIAWLAGWGIAAPIVFYPSIKGAWVGLMQAGGGLETPGENTRP